MGCTVQCRETGACCGNFDVNLICAWTKELLDSMQAEPGLGMEKVIKRCSKTHYEILDMDKMLEPFVGHPEALFAFLQEKWGWIVTVEEGGKRIIADENKAECVCPLVRSAAVDTANLCNCSEGFAERMFGKVYGRQVKARVVESVLRGGRHCVYEVTVGE